MDANLNLALKTRQRLGVATLWQRVRSNDTLFALLLCLPAIAVLLAFVYVPFVKAFGLSFNIIDRNTFEPGKFYGLTYYARIFNIGDKALGPDYINSMGTSILFTAIVVPLGLVGSLILARIASAKVKRIGFFRTIFSSTVAISVASAGVIWSLMYSPSIKLTQWVIDALGLQSTSLLNDAATALPAVALMTVWTNMGFQFLFALAGMQSIPRDILEAAHIDGARGIKGFIKIQLPLLGPTVLFLLVTSTISCLQAFTQFKVLIDGPGPNLSTNVFVYAIFNAFWMENNYGFASAMSVILFFLIFGFSVLQFRLDRRVHYQ